MTASKPKRELKLWRVINIRGEMIEMKAPTKTAAYIAASNLRRFGPIKEVVDPSAPPKIGGNAKCPCESGRKYKRCCGKKR